MAAFTAAVISTTQYADELISLSKKSGIATDDLSKLKYAAEQDGVSFDSLSNGLKFLAKNVETADKEFRSLGISTKDNNGIIKSADALLKEVADKFQKMPDGVEKTNIALKLFGRAGTDMIPMLNNGSEGIKALGDEAQKLGIVMGTSSAQAFKKFGDEMLAVKEGFRGLFIVMAENILPTIQSVANSIKNIVIWFNSLSSTTKYLLTSLMLLAAAITGLGGSMLLFIGYLPQLAKNLTMLNTGFKILWATMAANPVLAVGAAITGLILIVETAADAYFKWKESQLQMIKTKQQLMTALDAEIIRMKSILSAREQGKKSELEDDKTILMSKKQLYARIENFEESIQKTREKIHKEKIKQNIEEAAGNKKLIGTEISDLMELDAQDAAIRKIMQARADEMTTRRMAALNLLTSTATSAVELGNIQTQNKLQSDLAANEADYNAKKAWILANVTDETEKAQQLQALEQNRSDTERNLRDAAAKEEKKRREALKPFLIAEAVVNTALGVTKAFAQGGILGFITGALVAIAGGIEIAKIQAQKFASGVMNFGGGLALVGEQGPELVNLPRGSNVYRAGETASMINNSRNSNSNFGITVNVTGNNISNEMDLKKIADKVEAVILRSVKLERNI